MSGSVIVEAALRLAGIAHAMDRPEWLDTAGGHARDCVGPFGATLRGFPAGAGGGGGRFPAPLDPAYCLHDTREPGEPQPETSKRVEWTVEPSPPS